ncbi:MAG: putative sulfate exporter family transporter, partial [Bacteroidetes bacterium]
MANIKSILFVLVAVATVFTSPVVGLLAGIVFAVVFGNPLPSVSKKISKNLLQISVVGLGFGMNVHEALQSGRDGMLMTIVSVSAVLVIG